MHNTYNTHTYTHTQPVTRQVNMVLVYHSASIAPSAATGLSPPRRAPPPPPSSTPATADDDDDPDAFSNLMVSSEFVFDLEAYPPFATAFDVASPCPVAAAGATPQVRKTIACVAGRVKRKSIHRCCSA